MAQKKPENTDDVKKVWDKHAKKRHRIISFFSDVSEMKDLVGRKMRFKDYGDRDSPFGWEIDHSKPVSKGGTDHLNNLQPLHWKTNSEKGDTHPWKHSKHKRTLD